MVSSEGETAERPFVATSIARHFASRLQATHEERAISVISGPWGIGKTTALDAFAADNYPSCIVVKVDPGSSKKGATPIAVMQLTAEALRSMMELKRRTLLSNAYWTMRQMIYDHISDIAEQHHGWREREAYNNEHYPEPPLFTLIFDEAQYLSREAIEMLRFWNDSDRSTTPFPIGLFFVGNHEFALLEDASGQSPISGAVRSRALFIESLEYADVQDEDLALFIQSRGIVDPGAIAEVKAYFSHARVRRDFRNVERQISVFKRRAAGRPVTAEIVRSILRPS